MATNRLIEKINKNGTSQGGNRNRQVVEQLRSRGLSDENIMDFMTQNVFQPETQQEQFGSATEAVINPIAAGAAEKISETSLGDVVRGTPGVAKAAAQGVLQAPARAVESITREGLGAVTGEEIGGVLPRGDETGLQSAITSTFFGEEPAMTPSEIGVATEQALERTGVETTKTERRSIPGVALAGLAISLSDLTGWGSIRKLPYAKIANETNVDNISKDIRASLKNIDKKTADEWASQLKNVNTDQGVREFVESKTAEKAVENVTDSVTSRGVFTDPNAARQRVNKLAQRGAEFDRDGNVNLYIRGDKESVAQAKKTGDLSGVQTTFNKPDVQDKSLFSKLKVPVENINPRLGNNVDIEVDELGRVPTQTATPRTQTARNIEETVGTIRSPETKQEMLNLRARVDELKSMGSKSTAQKGRAIKSVQEALVNSIKGLPIRERGKLVTAIKNTQTTRGLEKALERVARVKESVERTESKRQEKLQKRRQAYAKLKEKGISDYGGIQALYNLPAVNKMSKDEIDLFIDVVDSVRKDDELLTKNIINRVRDQKAELYSGVLTKREALDVLAKETGVEPKELENMDLPLFVDYMHDSILGQQNTYLRLLTSRYQESSIAANAKFIKFEKQLDNLVKEARKSRKKTFGDRVAQTIAPTDSEVFKWLEGDKSIDLTPEEMKLAEFMQEQFDDALEYLTAADVIAKGRENYITHIRKGFSETLTSSLKEDSGIGAPVRAVAKALGSIYKQSREDIMPVSPISDTNNVLSPEKFFKFSLQRTGEVDPTENIAKAARAYFRTFYKKQELDKMFPEVMITADILLPSAKTPKGVSLENALTKFTNRYLNTKKGKPVDFDTPMGKNSLAGVTAMGVKGFTTVIDLGLNIPLMAANMFGDLAGVYTSVGLRKMMSSAFKGYTPLANKKYRNFLKENAAYFEKEGFWEDVMAGVFEPDTTLAQKTRAGLFSLYRFNRRLSDEIFLLSRATKEEISNGKIPNDKLADIRLEMGKYKNINEKSVFGATTVGEIATQYKTWAVPWVTQTTHNLNYLIKELRSGKVGALKEQEAAELARLLVGSIVIYTTIANSVTKDAEEQTQMDRFIAYAQRDVLSAVQAIQPSIWTQTPRSVTFLEDLGNVAQSMANWLWLELNRDDENAEKEYEKFKKGFYDTIIPAEIKRRIRDSEEVDERGVDFDSVDFGEVDFDAVDFGEINFEEVDFGEVDFEEVQF